MQVKFRNKSSACKYCSKKFIDKCGDTREGRVKKYCSKSCRYSSKTKTLHQRFTENISGRNSSGCIEWNGAIHKTGYGAIKCKEAGHKAHRAAWILAYGFIDKGAFLLHSCDNRKCVNVEHLRIGTAKDNSLDMTQRGRQSKGVGRWKAKLTDDIVRDIRTHFAKFKEPLSYYTSKYNVSPATISEVLNRRTWKHVR